MFNVFWLLVILCLIPLWFVLSPIFNFLGRKIYKLFDKTKKVLNDEVENQKNNEKKDGTN